MACQSVIERIPGRAYLNDYDRTGMLGFSFAFHADRREFSPD